MPFALVMVPPPLRVQNMDEKYSFVAKLTEEGVAELAAEHTCFVIRNLSGFGAMIWGFLSLETRLISY